MIPGETEREDGYIYGRTFAYLTCAIDALSRVMSSFEDKGRLQQAMVILIETREAATAEDQARGESVPTEYPRPGCGDGGDLTQSTP